METPANERLRLTEIFLSVQGEARSVGWPTVFVRLTGCPLRCQYCDTAYAFHGGEWWEIDATWMVIRTLAALGLAKDIQLLPLSAHRFRLDRDRTADERAPLDLLEAETAGALAESVA